MEIHVPGYQFIEIIKSGAQASVVQAKKNNVDYAVRVISNLQNPTNLARAIRELILLRNCNHENIIKIIDLPQPNNNNGTLTRLYITVPLMFITLEDFAKTNEWRNEKNENIGIRYIMNQLLHGVDFLHRNTILHRDLSSKNVMINQNLHLKIIDFGLAREIQNVMTNLPFTLPYQAPERMLEFEFYDSKVDMWAVGCLFAELILGHRLFLTENTALPGTMLLKQCFELEENIPIIFDLQMIQILSDEEITFINDRIYQPLEVRINIPPPLGPNDDIKNHSVENGISALKGLLQLLPNERWSAEEALNNPFFASDRPIEGILNNPDECQQVFDQTNEALDNKNIPTLLEILKIQIERSPRI